MEKQSFPPSQTLTLDVECGEDLVGPVDCVHFQVVGLKNLRLSNMYVCLCSTIFLLPAYLDVVIGIAHSCNHGHDPIIHPL